ncbi:MULTISPECIES: hypothetical protein [Stenotrophomonas]|uniref:hypothetical protein n=1 Tax=Stenotrophomonas TaxID=40323 RepID=UPI000872958E|nr:MULTISPECIES: hypothetical protein [Stenotrophomonas]OEZ02308.1 hypothetical protein BIY45_01910 [Stenotrophomonas sp. BIIR7]
MTIGWPQIIVLGLMFVSLGLEIGRHGTAKAREVDNHSAWGEVVGSVVMIGLLYWGGFFG